MNNVKSAVAVFFLFFLHGISIGNGQQGISYNIRGLMKLEKALAQMFGFSRMLIGLFTISFNLLLSAARSS